MTTVTDQRDDIRAELLVHPGASANLKARDTTWTGSGTYAQLSADELNANAKTVLGKGVDQLAEAQELLWSTSTHAVLVVFQAIDAAGKDSTIKHVMTGVNPQGVEVTSFKKPSKDELAHTFLWRIANAVPARGRIGIFNRSQYEDVVALKVHPEWFGREPATSSDGDAHFWRDRCDDINAFEHHLARNGTAVVKFFLHVSKAEQKCRFLARLDQPNKEWKFNAADVAERALWDRYMQAYEETITATSTAWAPWYVIPADQKHVMQAMVAAILVDTIDALKLAWPVVSDSDRAANAAAREALDAEAD